MISCFGIRITKLTNSSSVDITDLHPFHVETIFNNLSKAIDDRLSVRGRQKGVRIGGFKRFRASESESVVPVGGDAQTKLPRSFRFDIGDDNARISARNGQHV